MSFVHLAHKSKQRVNNMLGKSKPQVTLTFLVKSMTTIAKEKEYILLLGPSESCSNLKYRNGVCQKMIFFIWSAEHCMCRKLVFYT